MPHIPVHPSAQKRHRQNLKRAERNRAVKTHVHSAVKDTQQALSAGNAEQAAQALQQSMKVLGKAATKGVIHRNTMARKISRLARQLNHVKSQAAS